MKQCKKCGVEKILEQFSKHARCKDGRQGTCIECTSKNTSAWLVLNRERKALTDSLWERNNKEHRKEIRKATEQKDPPKHKRNRKKYNLRKRYNISLEEYDRLFEVQQGLCRICKRSHTEFARGLVVDHSHVTGKIRGLLCDPCNRALGYFRDNIVTMQSAIEYINQDPSL